MLNNNEEGICFNFCNHQSFHSSLSQFFPKIPVRGPFMVRQNSWIGSWELFREPKTCQNMILSIIFSQISSNGLQNKLEVPRKTILFFMVRELKKFGNLWSKQITKQDLRMKWMNWKFKPWIREIGKKYQTISNRSNYKILLNS